MEVNKFLGTLQHAVEATWTQHLRASKYNVHNILNDFYDDMLDNVDDLIEHYMGLHGKVENLENTIEPGDDPIVYLEKLRKFVDDNYNDYKESELQSDLDDIKATIDTALYKLKEMTKNESRQESFKSLSEFLKESLD